MVSVLRLSLVIAVGGCAQLFGIDNTSGPGATFATLQFNEIQVGASLVRGPLDLSSSSSQFLAVDPTQNGGLLEVPGVQMGADTWYADIPGNPAIEFTLPDAPHPMQRLWAFPARAVKGSYTPYRHPNPSPPMPMSAIAFTVGLNPAYQATDTFVIEAIGAWSAHQLTGPELPSVVGAASLGPVTIPYSSFTAMTGNSPTAIVGADTVVILRYNGAQLIGVFQAANFDQTNGTDTLQGGSTLNPVNPDRAVDGTIDPMGYGVRFSAVNPRVSGLNMGWSINAAPAYSLGHATGPRLNAGNPLPTDTKFSAMYASPFESQDWKPMLTFSAGETRTYMFMGAPITLAAGAFTVATPATGLNFNFPTGFPQTISIGQTRLTSDGITVTLDQAQPVDVSFFTDSSQNTLYMIRVFELLPGMSSPSNFVIEAVTTQITDGIPHFTLPGKVFEPGHTYFIEAFCYQGGPVNAAMGDFQTTTVPFTAAYLDSGVFTVVPQ